MPFKLEMTPQERSQVEAALADALELRETIRLGVEAEILAPGLQESNETAIARAEALLKLSSG